VEVCAVNERGKFGGRERERCKDDGDWGLGPGDPALIGFCAVCLFGANAESEECIRPDRILFAFTPGALKVAAEKGKKPSIVARWIDEPDFSTGTVFLRTRTRVYRSHLRTLREFRCMVNSAHFDRVSRSVVANLWEADSVSLGRQKHKMLSYDVEESEFSWPVEFVTVSRQYLRGIRRRFAMPPGQRARRSPQPNATPPGPMTAAD
jgi:hypothetical protein